MIPGTLDLPDIWIGSDYGPILLFWRDSLGNPLDLTGWSPFAQADNSFDLHATIIDVMNGQTQISMSNTETSLLTLGVVNWDWIWQRNSPLFRLAPLLMGKIHIKQPTTVPVIST